YLVGGIDPLHAAATRPQAGGDKGGRCVERWHDWRNEKFSIRRQMLARGDGRRAPSGIGAGGLAFIARDDAAHRTAVDNRTTAHQGRGQLLDLLSMLLYEMRVEAEEARRLNEIEAPLCLARSA